MGQEMLSCLLSDWGLLTELSAVRNLFLLASPPAQVRMYMRMYMRSMPASFNPDHMDASIHTASVPHAFTELGVPPAAWCAQGQAAGPAP